MTSNEKRPSRPDPGWRVTSLWSTLAHDPLAIPGDLWRRLQERLALDRAAQLAFWFLLAFFPLLLSVSAVFGIVLEEQVGLRNALLRWIGRVLPDQASMKLIQDVLDDIQKNTSGPLGIGLALALWAASNGVHEVHRIVDRDLGGPEKPNWRRRLSAIPLTLAVSVPVVAAIVLIFYGRELGSLIAGYLETTATVFLLLWEKLRWPLMILAMVLTFDVVYNGASAMRRYRARWLTPGAVAAILLWLLVSYGLQVYVSQAQAFSRFYGSLGAVVGLLFWFFFSALALLVGIYLNGVLLEAESATGVSPEPPRPPRPESEPT